MHQMHVSESEAMLLGGIMPSEHKAIEHNINIISPFDWPMRAHCFMQWPVGRNARRRAGGPITETEGEVSTWPASKWITNCATLPPSESIGGAGARGLHCRLRPPWASNHQFVSNLSRDRHRAGTLAGVSVSRHHTECSL